MQKEILLNKPADTENSNDGFETTPKTDEETSGRSEAESPESTASGIPDNEPPTTESLNDEFDRLIKGPYKDAFAAKVQGIINKRFKEQKISENSIKEKTVSPNEPLSSANPKQPETDDSLKALIEAGIDEETAYKVLHLDEMLDSSMRYGASLAAKQLADSIRLKGIRPKENGLNNQGGFTAHKGAAGLTPEKRRELAKKALMGEHIGF